MAISSPIQMNLRLLRVRNKDVLANVGVTGFFISADSL